jgi:hypothetical protein
MLGCTAQLGNFTHLTIAVVAAVRLPLGCNPTQVNDFEI